MNTNTMMSPASKLAFFMFKTEKAPRRRSSGGEGEATKLAPVYIQSARCVD
ncbi:hypothetical protein [Herbaspirillum frisingense]|uniref:hypothetical protein n=1 Tax=Herbaspirillum frisingense TaxID=92645 RepID=UPI0039AFE5F4